MPDQLELSFGGNPFVLRCPIDEGLWLFWDLYWKTTTKGKGTKKSIVRLIRYFKEISSLRYIDEIAKTHIIDLRKWLKSLGFSTATINTHHMITTLCFNKFAEWKRIRIYKGYDFSKFVLPETNPGALVKKGHEEPKSSRPWPKRLIFKLIDIAYRLNDIFMAHYIEFSYLSGLRPSDLFRLEEKNIDFAHKIAVGVQHKTITNSLPSGIPYTITLSEKMTLILKELISNRPKNQPLFWDQKYNYESWRRQVNRRFNVIRKAAGAPHITPYSLRSSKATLLMDNGIDAETVREAMGWTTLRMLPVYAKRTLAHQRRAQEKLEDEDSEIIL